MRRRTITGGYGQQLVSVIAVVIVPIFFLGFWDACFGGHGFEFYVRGDTYQMVMPGEATAFWFTLINTGDERDVFRFDCRVLNSVPGSSVIYCVGGVCAEPGVPLYDSLAAGESDTAIDVSIFAGVEEGEILVQLAVRSRGDTTLADSIVVQVQVSQGVDEKRQDVSVSPRRVLAIPNPVTRGRTLKVIGEESGSCKIELFNSVGSRVATIDRSGCQEAGGAIAWRLPAGLSPGVHFLRVIDGKAERWCQVVVE